MKTVVISIDAELGWGFHDLQTPPRTRVESARRGWTELLELLDSYRLPATWAVVGHLLLAGCDGRHDDHPAPPDWFGVERSRWRDRPDLRFGGELIDDLRSSPIPHEIACHSFSHVLFDEERTSRELARAELTASIDAARARGISFDSFVYPRNQVGYRDLLAEAGFRCYRGRQPGVVGQGRLVRTIGKLARSTLFEPSPTIVSPSVDEYGLVNIPASLFLFSFSDLPRRVVEPVWGHPIVSEVRRGVDAVIEEGGVFHLWLHPNNLRGEADVRLLREVLAHVAERVATTELSVETMAAVASAVREKSDAQSVVGRPAGRAE